MSEELDPGFIDQPTRWQLSYWWSWKPTSMALLAKAEQNILAPIWHLIESKFVPINNGTKTIRTIILNKASDSIPLVMVHGLSSGVGLWTLNLENLSKDRPVYAIDLLGFGRSTRCDFSKDAILAEMEFVDSIEDWRVSMKLDKFILLGHSFGGFLATSYALRYPDKIKHLILVEPWGYAEKQAEMLKRTPVPMWVRVVARIMEPFNPLAALRVAGPLGPELVKKFRPDLLSKFRTLYEDDTVPMYIYHCNAQYPSGETAFRNMTIPIAWPKHPMIKRVSLMSSRVPVTFIYGSRSWMDSSIGYQVKYIRNGSYVDVQVIHSAGHHVYADKYEQFNKLVNQICLAASHGSGQFSLDGFRRRRNRSESMQTSFSISDLPSMTPGQSRKGLASSASESVLAHGSNVESQQQNADSKSRNEHEKGNIFYDEIKEEPRDTDSPM